MLFDKIKGNILKFKSFSLASIALAAALTSGAGIAATSSNTLTLQWAGTIPAAPVTSGSWGFVSSTDSTVSFVPTQGTITVQDGIVAGTKKLTLSPVNFSIAATAGTFTNASKVKAYLGSAVTFTGLNAAADAGTADAPSLELKVNNIALSVGSTSSADVATVGATNGSLINMAITGEGLLPAKAFTFGDTFTASSTIVMTADVA